MTQQAAGPDSSENAGLLKPSMTPQQGRSPAHGSEATPSRRNKRDIKMRIQHLFLLIMLALFAILGPFTYITYITVTDFIANKPADYRWPQFSDFWFTAVTTVVCMVLEKVFDKAFYPLYYPICKEKVDEEARVMRTKKAVKNIFKFFYYSCAAIAGWLTLKDNYVLPPMLGGSGSFYNQFMNWPYFEHPPLYKYYFTGTMGFHLGALLNQLLFEDYKKSDFIEMTLHHLVTVYLYGFSYMSNTLIGAPVAFLHNWADVFVSWTRIWAESHVKNVAGYSFVIAQIVWFYSRIYVFPQLIYASTISLEVYTASPFVQPIFGALLWCLFILHVYWFILMQKILLTFFLKGVAEDTVNKNKPNADEQKALHKQE